MPNIIKKIIVKIISIFRFLFAVLPYGIEIPFEVKIGEGLRLVHLNGIIISKYAIIGKKCTILHQVTIGVNDKKDAHKGPTIGDNVFIGAGAKIIGDIQIGNNVSIGANTVVTIDIPENCTVVGCNRIIEN